MMNIVAIRYANGPWLRTVNLMLTEDQARDLLTGYITLRHVSLFDANPSKGWFFKIWQEKEKVWDVAAAEFDTEVFDYFIADGVLVPAPNEITG